MADDGFDAFKAMVQAQKNAEKPAKHIKFDPDAFGADEKENTTERPKHAHKRTTTEAILLKLASLGDEFGDDQEYDDAEDVAFLHSLNDYLGDDFATHKRAWSTISNSKSEALIGGGGGGGTHSRSGTLYSLQHNRSRKQSMDLLMSTQKIEKKQAIEEMIIFGLLSADIKQLRDFIENKIDLNVLWSFFDIILFKLIKEYSSANMKLSDIYVEIFKLFSKRKLLQNESLRQYLKFLTSSNSYDTSKDNLYNPISALLDNLMHFEDANDEIIDLSNDKLILSWKYIANKGVLNEEIDVNSKLITFYDPIRCSFDFKNCIISKIQIRKVFNSANKPLLLDVYCKDLTVSSVVLKKGDDLRKDKALMNIFKFMNYIWYKHQNSKNKQQKKYTLTYKKSLVKILTFNVIAMTNTFGVLELVSNCIPLRHIESIEDELIEEHKINLLSSAAASYIGSFVCGVKDRHFDNILVRTNDATLFHIDFGYCLGESIKNPFAIDTSIFAITEKFFNVIGKENYEKYFVPLCVDAYMCLRQNYKELIEFTILSFSYLFKEKQYKKIEEFLMKKLKVKEKNEEDIRQWLANEIKKAPFSKKTKLKNKLHRINSPTLTDDELKAPKPSK